MENKVLVLSKEGTWFEFKNCILIGAAEYPDKIVYHKFLYSEREDDVLKELLKKAEEFVAQQKKTLKK